MSEHMEPLPTDTSWLEMEPNDGSIWHTILGWALAAMLGLCLATLAVTLVAVSGALG